MKKGDAGQAQRIIEQIEREQRHQPDEGDEPPAFALDTLLELVQTPSAALFHLVRYPGLGQIAGQQERQHGAQGRSGEVVEGPPNRTKQRATGEGNDRAGQKQHRNQRVQDDKQQRTRGPGTIDPSPQRSGIYAVAVRDGQDDSGHQ